MTFSEPCPHCHGAGRILSRETVATKIERWFNRAKTDGQFKKYDLAVNPHLADSMMTNGINRVNKIMKILGIKINVIRDTTIPVQEFKVFDTATNTDLTDEYKA